MWKDWFGSGRLNEEIDDELNCHLELRTRDLERRGLSAEAARRQARLELGSSGAKAEECREARGLLWLDEARRNLRFALRQLRRNPAFAVSAILTLGLCIGVNTAIFSAVDALLLRSPPYPEPDRLRLLAIHLAGGEVEDVRLSHDGHDWETIRDHAGAVEAAVFKLGAEGRNLAAGDQAQFVLEQRVGAGFFRVLGVSPAFGREFRPDEDRPGGPAITVISHALATRLFEDPADAVGRMIQLKGEPSLVTGVMPAGFESSAPADVWTPLRPSTRGEGEGANYSIVLRVKEGLSVESAEAAMAPLLEELFDVSELETNGVDVAAQLRLLPLKEGLSQSHQASLLLLWVAGAAVLFIGCVNIGGLLMARLDGRRRELALRRSLGGGRGVVARQLLTESLMLGLYGCATGVLLGYASLGALRAFLREGLGVKALVEIDLRVLAVTAAVSVGCSVLLGLYPAWRAGRLSPLSAFDGGSHVAGTRSSWTRRLLVIGQTGACLLLLAGAGLMLCTLDGLRSLEPGFDPEGVATINVSLDDARYATTEATSRLFDGALRRIESTPGVLAAGVAQSLPYERAVNLGVSVVGDESGPQSADVVYVAGNIFQALGIPLLRGRVLDERDSTGAEPAVLVNRAFVARRLQDLDPLSTFVSLGGAKRRIVGVAGDVLHNQGWGHGDPLTARPTVYLPAAQMEGRALALVNSWSNPSFVVRSSLPATAAFEAIRAGVSAADPLLPVKEFRSMAEVQRGAWARQRAQAVLLSALGVLALALAAVGIYGLIASLAEARRREAAIRIALGAASWQTVRTVALPGLALTTTGVAAGLALTPAASGLIENMLWGVEPQDPGVLAAAAALLVVTAAIASLAPALRLLHIQPAAVLREE